MKTTLLSLLPLMLATVPARMLLPLPGGEGRGEGERDAANQDGRTNLASSTDMAWRSLKTTLISLLPLLLATTGRALDTFPQDAKPADAPSFSIAERGPNHRLWTNSTGGTYTELANGLHYLDPNGNWVESSEEIQIVNGHGVAQQGQHQVIFAPNVNTVPAIDLSAPDGKRFQSRVTGIAYYDRASGKGAWIGETKDAEGLVVGANQVIYPDAFTTTRADMRYTYTKYGLEQDLILREQPPSPEQFGLNPGTTSIQVWTEFFRPPAPQVSTRAVYQEPDPLARQAMVVPDLLDEDLGFEASEIRQGIAFTIGDDGKDPMQSDGRVPVCKQWASVAARDFLIESVPYEWLKPLLITL